MKEVEYRSYRRTESVVFWKTREKFGELSNMASGFPLLINEIIIHSSEALYQACKFPHIPDLQKKILGQTSPLLAKRVCKPFEGQEREDWIQIRTTVMRWCIKVKLVQNWVKLSPILLESEEKPIVEYSEKDDFWGALPWDNETLQGRNVLGRLLMELREQLKTNPKRADWDLTPPPINSFLILGIEIKTPGLNNGGNSDLSELW